MACTANDVRLTFADNVRSTSGVPLTQCVSGERFSFIADFHVQTIAKTRYDIGLYFATDGDPNGDGASSGVCSSHIIRESHRDPAYPYTVMLGTVAAANLDKDSCLDITAAQGWRQIAGKVVTVRVDDVRCHDNDGAGKLTLPYCTSWSETAEAICNSPQNAAPSSSANCGCNIAFNLPVSVAPGSTQVTSQERRTPSDTYARDVSLLLETAAPQDPEL